VQLSLGGFQLRLSALPTVVVTGVAFSGISIMVVVPPAAAALVAVSKPSHSVRPRLVDVYVRVDHTGHDDLVAERSRTEMPSCSTRPWQDASAILPSASDERGF
jgi:hypothetical protein